MKLKYYSLLFLAGIIYTNSFAQPVIKAQRAFGGNSSDILTSMYLTKDGGLIAGGFSYSSVSGEKTENSRGAEDYWLIKLDSPHNIQWDKTIGGNGSDQLTSLQQTNDGGYILGGWSVSSISGEKTESGRGGVDYWVVKLDDRGNIQWDKTIGGSNHDELYSLQQISDGGYIIGGWSFSNISGEKTENTRGGSYYGDYWVIKLDGLGNVQWDKTIGGNNDDVLNSLQQTGDGGYIVGGWSSSNKSGEKTENNRCGCSDFSNSDYWVVKLDGLGNVQWDKTIGGNKQDVLYSLRQTNDGGYILGGYSDSNISGEKTKNNRGFGDYWIIKLDSSGNIQWDKTIGGEGVDLLTSLQQTSDNGYILAGWSESNISYKKTENSRGATDYWVVRLNSHGKIQWDKTIGGSEEEGTSGSVIIKEIGKNRYVIGGTSISGTTGDKKRLSRGDEDFWLVGLFNKTGSHELEEPTQNIAAPNTNKTKGFLVYPNPAKNTVTVNYTAQKNGHYLFELTDLSGKVLLRKQTSAMQGENHTNIDVSRFVKGVYFINIIKPDKTRERMQLSKE